MKYLVTILLSAVVSLAGFLGLHQEQQYQYQELVGANTVQTIGGQTYTLAGSGLSSSATSITLTSLTIPQTGYKLVDGDFSSIFYLTLEPGSRSRQEFVSCTTVTQNAAGTATLSGCERGLLPFSPYTASTTYAFSHSGGTSVIFSNPPQLYEQIAFKGNDETVTGMWSFPTPLSNAAPATKGYVDSLVSGGNVTNVAVVIPGNAGETVATGTLVYLDGTDQEWKKVDVDTTTTFIDKFIGLTQGAGTDGATIVNGVLLYGRDNTQTGLTPGSTYYASSTAGEITTTVTEQPLGVAESSTVLNFDPKLIYPRLASDNTWTGENTFSATSTFSGSVVFSGTLNGHASTSVTTYTASTTWEKPDGLEYIEVWVCGGGASGEGGDSDGVGGGGGGGGCAFGVIDESELSATTTITIGGGGVGVSGNGATGGNTTFGSFLTGNGGVGGSSNTGGAGGTATGGDINLSGRRGSNAFNGTPDISGEGGDSVFGFGGTVTYGAGAGLTGQGYGAGGSGASNTGNGGNGTNGVVIIREVF